LALKRGDKGKNFFEDLLTTVEFFSEEQWEDWDEGTTGMSGRLGRVDDWDEWLAGTRGGGEDWDELTGSRHEVLGLLIFFWYYAENAPSIC
jgi:hypothetical protein